MVIMNDKEFFLIMTKTLLIGVAIVSAAALIEALFFPGILLSTVGTGAAEWVKNDPESYRWIIAALSAIALPTCLITAHQINSKMMMMMKKLKDIDYLNRILIIIIAGLLLVSWALWIYIVFLYCCA